MAFTLWVSPIPVSTKLRKNAATKMAMIMPVERIVPSKASRIIAILSRL